MAPAKIIALEKTKSLLKGDYGISTRSIALLLLQEDGEIISLVQSKDAHGWPEIDRIVKEIKAHYHEPLSYIIALAYHEEAQAIVEESVRHVPKEKLNFKERLSRMMIHPLTGIPILLLILYYGLYKAVALILPIVTTFFIAGHADAAHAISAGNPLRKAYAADAVTSRRIAIARSKA